MLNPVPEIANVNRLSLDIPLTVMLPPTPGIVWGVLYLRMLPAADCVAVSVALGPPAAATVIVEERLARPVCALAPVVNVLFPVPLVLLTVFHACFAIRF
jgi:hypothetical protein